MSSSNTFPNVSATCWACVQQSSIKQHNTVYTPPPPATSGESDTPTAVGHVKMSFNYDAASSTISYSILDKPGIVTDGEIWGGISDSIKSCGGG